MNGALSGAARHAVSQPRLWKSVTAVISKHEMFLIMYSPTPAARAQASLSNEKTVTSTQPSPILRF
jgi:hypothetical protein